MPAGEPTTRREHLRRLALASLLGQSACLEDADSESLRRFSIYTAVFFGQSGSRVSARFERLAREAAEREEEDRLRRQMSFFDPSFPPPPIPSFQPVTGPASVNGIAADSVSGPPPAPGPGPTLTEESLGPRPRRPSQSVDRRAIYLLDTLGDAQVDGRVYAFDVTGDAVTLRGQAGLRPRDRSLPSIQLRHLARISHHGREAAAAGR